jgi:hypothetical protein
MSEEKLIFTQEDADLIFEELAELQVDLDNDPLSFGPKRLNSKLSDVRRMLSRCERVFLDASHRYQTVRRALRFLEGNLDIERKHLYANDPETRAGRSVSDREAIASGKLLKSIRRSNELTVVLESLDSVLVVIRAKRSDLKDTEGRLRDQMKLCQEELSLGGRWGLGTPSVTVDLNQGRATGADVKALEEMLAAVDGEIHLSQLKGEFPEEAPETVCDPLTPDIYVQIEKPEPTVVEPEPISEDLEVLPISENAFRSNVDHSTVESFLEEPLMPVSMPKTRMQKAMQEAQEINFEELLSNFESLE